MPISARGNSRGFRHSVPGTGDKDQECTGTPPQPHLSFQPATKTVPSIRSLSPSHTSQHLQPSRPAVQQVRSDTSCTHFMVLG